MKYIKVQIECNVDSGDSMKHIPEDLREQLVFSGVCQTEYREGLVFVDHIAGIYPWSSGDSHVLLLNGESFTVKESIQEIENKLNGL